MAQRVLQRIEPERTIAFDERAWPVHGALWLLGGVTAAVIVQAGGWQEPHPLYNGWVRLVTLGLTLAALTWAITVHNPRRARRLRFAVLVSLIGHLLLSVVLEQNYLHLLAEPPKEHSVVAKETLPELVQVQVPLEEVQQEYERPVEVEPIVDVQEVPLDKRPEETPEAAVQVQVVEHEETLQTPAEIERQKQLPTRPKRSEELAKRDRKPSEVASSSGKAIAPEQATKAAQEKQKLAASLSDTPRQVTKLPKQAVDKNSQQQELESQKRALADANTLNRSTPSRTPQEQQPEIAKSKPLQDRKPHASTTAVETEANHEAIAKKATQPTPVIQPSLEPQTNEVARAASPRVEDIKVTPLEPTLADTARTTERFRQDQEQAQPTLARSPSRTRSRTPIQYAPTANATAASEQPSKHAVEDAISTLMAQTTALQRAETASMPESQSKQSDVSESLAQIEPDLSFTIASVQAVHSPPPSIQPTERAANTPRRAVDEAAAAASPTNATMPSIAASSNTSRADHAPKSLALARASEGFLGRARSPNAGADLPTSADHLAPSPSVAARREEALQQRQGPALSPSRNSRLAKATAGSDAPSAPAMAQPLAVAELAGSKRPGKLAVSASAAMEERYSTAAAGEITASVGSAELDTGAEQITPAKGTGRSAGGGQPKIELAAAAPVRRAATGGGAVVSAVNSNVVAETPRAPAASGGGLPASASRLAASQTKGTARTATAVVLAKPTEGGFPEMAASGPSGTTSLQRVASKTKLPGRTSGAGTAARRSHRGVASPAMAKAQVPTRATTPATGGAPKGPILAAAEGATRLSRTAGGNSGKPTAGASANRATEEASNGGIARSSEAATEGFGAANGQVPSANIGDGGLGLVAATSAGIPDRLAHVNSKILLSTNSRFMRKRSTGLPTIRGTARKPAPAFARRSERGEPKDAASPEQPSEKTEAAIELGLAYLAKLQKTDGSWALERNGVDLARATRERPLMKSDAAATGLALLTFLGAGYDHFDEKYKENIRTGLDYLVGHQKPNGDLYIRGDAKSTVYARYYSHGIATIALCEAYGMTGDEKLRVPAQKAVDFILASQHKEFGGWRYQPGEDSDLSVTGWQVMALRSAELAGLNVYDAEQRTIRARRRITQAVPLALVRDVGGLVAVLSMAEDDSTPLAYERVRMLLAKSRVPGNTTYFAYNPNADAVNPRSPHARKPSTVMTSIGMLTSLYVGANRTSPEMQAGAEHLLANLPKYGNTNARAAIGTMGNPLRDTYYWYYATQVMYHMRGKYWDAWHAQLHPILLQTQTKQGPLAGSWDPYDRAPDKWARHGGRLYVTTMNLLSLEVYYRHLPLYESAGP